MNWNIIRIYLRLGRIHSAVLTGLAPAVAAAATGTSLSIYHYLELFLIGLLFHFYLFVYNELRDIAVDKTSGKLKGKPLVDGSITIKSAKTIVFSSIALTLILSIVFFQEKAVMLIPISLLAFLFGGLYDILGKRFPHADYFIATSFFFLTIYGGFSVSQDLNVLVYVIGVLAFMQMLFQNIVAGLKDVDHDYLAGGTSTPIRMGVKIEGKRVLISKKFIAYVSILKMINIFLLITPFIYRMMPFESWQFFISLLLIVIAIFFMIRFLTIKLFDREKIMRSIGFHEMFMFMVIPFILFTYIGLVGMLFLVFFPVIWLGVFLSLLYRRLMPVI
ncbi:MAG: UbiA family prenyltransferase [Thermoplasmatales archaeon]|nr:UbiA family prenyltransferase [Thermoplasmatales archaeon]